MTLDRISVLIIDDEAVIRESLTDFLEDFDFQVSSAETAEQALEMVENNKYDVAIVDMRLPGMDGNGFITNAAKIDKKIKYLIHTGSVNYKLTSKLLELGIRSEDILLKPVFTMGIFVEAIRRLAAE